MPEQFQQTFWRIGEIWERCRLNADEYSRDEDVSLASELLLPAYRVLLWSWSPIRLAADALRSLLFSGGVAPAVGTGVTVFAGIGVVALLVVMVPLRRRTRPGPTDTDAAQVAVG